METIIETMDLDGVREAVAWAEREGWQPGDGDHRAFHAADPQGFFRARAGDRTVATLSVVRGSDEVAFIGLFIVDPEHRGQGFGRELWDDVLARFDGLTLGLDAVPEQIDAYASVGFIPAWENARYTVAARELPAPDPAIRVKPASSVRFDELVGFDGSHFFGPRPGFLREWIDGDDREAVVTTGPDGRITGFAVSRGTSIGNRIGPFFAEDDELALAMLSTLAAGLEGTVALDVPESNRAAFEMVRKLGLDRSFETTRMYRGPAPELPLDQIFGITTLELG